MKQVDFFDLASNLDLWNETIKIYRDSFPTWEREDEENILKNVRTNRYKMFGYREDEIVLGFFILDVNPALNYALLSFLAIKESRRGEGIGSKLCLNAVEYFHSHIDSEYLFIEAEERQALLYERLGFTRLDLDYRIPAFDSSQSVKMNLMMVQEEKKIDKISLAEIIKDIFLKGYSLDEKDIRIEEQLLRIESFG